MDDLLKWLPVILAIFAAGTAWGAHRLAAKHMSDKIAEVRDLVDLNFKKHGEHHEKHFLSSTQASVVIGQLKQQADDHAKSDDDRFTDLKNSLNVIHEDIKKLLSR